MKLFAPKYYKKFKCIADKCRHSCCVGWEIDVDASALHRYKELGKAGEEILSTIDFSGDSAHFSLLGDDRCPHLRADGLCDIICKHGEGYLCDICREHPRFYNITCAGRELGIGASCEAAARIILSSDSYTDFLDVEDPLTSETECDILFDAPSRRDEIYSVLSDRSIPYSERLGMICDSFSVSVLALSDEEWRGVISELEYLSEDSRALFLNYSSGAVRERCEYLERALAYFIYRHTGSAESEENFRCSLGLALFLERLYASISSDSASENELISLLVKLSEEIEYSVENSDRIKNEFLFI